MATITNVPWTTVAVGNEKEIIVGPLRLMMAVSRRRLHHLLPWQ
jgi:hypothetical protein